MTFILYGTLPPREIDVDSSVRYNSKTDPSHSSLVRNSEKVNDNFKNFPKRTHQTKLSLDQKIENVENKVTGKGFKVIE